MIQIHPDLNLSQYIRLKELACRYFLLSRESSKVLSAVEESDALIDFLDIYLELSQYYTDETLEDSHKRYPWITKQTLQKIQEERDTAYEMFQEATEVMKSFFDNNQRLDPIIKGYIPQTQVYLEFKKKANAILPWERTEHLGDLDSAFKESYPQLKDKDLDHLLEGEDLGHLFEEAMKEIKSHLKEGLQQLPFQWYRLISFCDRTLLENEGIFRVRQEKQHLLFADMLDASHPLPLHSSQPDHKIRNLIRQLQRKLKAFLLPKAVYTDGSASSDLYQTPKLDRYLYLRDLRMNLVRKWAHSIPLRMNHLLIKLYNEPHYWGSDHLFLTDIDQLRLGFAYFQYAMELRNASEYTAMIYRKSLNCFRKCQLRLPVELREKLWGLRV